MEGREQQKTPRPGSPPPRPLLRVGSREVGGQTDRPTGSGPSRGRRSLAFGSARGAGGLCLPRDPRASTQRVLPWLLRNGACVLLSDGRFRMARVRLPGPSPSRPRPSHSSNLLPDPLGRCLVANPGLRQRGFAGLLPHLLEPRRRLGQEIEPPRPDLLCDPTAGPRSTQQPRCPPQASVKSASRLSRGSLGQTARDQGLHAALAGLGSRRG